MDRDVKSRREYRVKLEKDQLDYSKLLEDEDLRKDVICSECHSQKDFVMTPYWGATRRYYTGSFICSKCEGRR